MFEWNVWFANDAFQWNFGGDDEHFVVDDDRFIHLLTPVAKIVYLNFR